MWREQWLQRRTLLSCAFAFISLSVFAQEPSSHSGPDDIHILLNAGVAAFKVARYEEAVENFRKVVQADPGNQKAHLYLAMAYSVQIVPNLQTQVNLQVASSALAEFDIVLKADSGDVSALRQEAAIYRNIQQPAKAKVLEKEVLRLDPQNAEALYTVGVIDWQQAYKNSITVLAKEGLTDDGMGNPKLSNAGCDVLEEQNAALVDDAVASLTAAIQLKPMYDDAMQYLNLIYRRRAELHCHDRSAAIADIVFAKQWNQRAMKARKENESPVLK